MTLQIKKGGAYAAPIAVSVKKNGVYTAVVGVFAKVGGAYQSVLGGAPSGEFDPISLSKLSAFYTALDSASNTGTQWLDQSANARHGTKVGPVSYSASVASANGYPGMVWPDTQAGTPTGFDLPAMTIQEMIVVVTYKDGIDALADVNSTVISGLSGANGFPRESIVVSSALWQAGTGTQALVGLAYVDGGLPTSGVQVTSATALPAAFKVFNFRAPVSYAEAGWKLGYNADLTNRCWAGAQTMVFLFSETLTAKERYQVYGYINEKLGKPLPIPSWSLTKVAGTIIPNTTGNFPYYADIIEAPAEGPGDFWVYSSGDHAAESGVNLHILYGPNPSAPTSVETYDQALALGKFAYLATKPAANPIWNYTAVGDSTETPRIRKIGATYVMHHQQGHFGTTQETLRVKSTDGVNFTLDRSILHYELIDGVGDGHTGYMQWGANPFDQLINPVTGLKYGYVGYALHGGTVSGFFGQWATDDAVNGDWALTAVMQKTTGRVVGDRDRFVSLIGLDMDTIKDYRGVGYSAVATLAAFGGAAGTGVPSEICEFVFDKKGQNIIGRPISIMLNGTAGAADELSVETPRSIVVGGQRKFIYNAVNSANLNSEAGAFGDDDLASVAVFPPLLPAIPTAGVTTLSVDFTQPGATLPAWMSFVQIGTTAPTYAISADGLAITATNVGAIPGQAYFFVDPALLPTGVKFIEMDIEGWGTPSTAKNRVPMYGLANSKTILSAMTDAYYLNNVGTGGVVDGKLWKQKRIASVDTAASLSAKYWGLGLNNATATCEKRLGLRWFVPENKFYLSGENQDEFEVIAQTINTGIPYYLFFGMIPKAADVTERIKRITVRYGS